MTPASVAVLFLALLGTGLAVWVRRGERAACRFAEVTAGEGES